MRYNNLNLNHIKKATAAVLLFFVTGCSVNVTEQMIVSPSTEINQQNFNQLVSAQGYQERFYTRRWHAHTRT